MAFKLYIAPPTKALFPVINTLFSKPLLLVRYIPPPKVDKLPAILDSFIVGLLLFSAKIDFQIFETVNAGFQVAKIKCKQEEMIFVGGSNFVVGEFLEKNL